MLVAEAIEGNKLSNNIAILVFILIFFSIVGLFLIFPILFYIIVFLGIVIPSYILYKNYKKDKYEK
jgi:hypothetical protein